MEFNKLMEQTGMQRGAQTVPEKVLYIGSWLLIIYAAKCVARGQIDRVLAGRDEQLMKATRLVKQVGSFTNETSTP